MNLRIYMLQLPFLTHLSLKAEGEQSQVAKRGLQLWGRQVSAPSPHMWSDRLQGWPGPLAHLLVHCPWSVPVWTQTEKLAQMFLRHTQWSRSLLRVGIRFEVVPEHKIAEEGVTLAHSEIVQQGLWHVTGVLEKAGETGEHLHNL